jgi:omega-amidase
MKISLAQIDIIIGKPGENQAKAFLLIQEAAHQQSDLVLLPELWSTGYDLSHCHDYATSLGTGLFSWLAEQAKTNHIFIGGSLLEEYLGKVYNSFVLFDPCGELAAVYRKTHLFRLMQEDQWLCAGSAFTMVNLPWGKVGMAVCYDLRFPEMFRYYLASGITMALIPAEWPLKRISHWSTLLRARAIENQIFIIAVNRVGESDGEVFGGHSCIISPWGETIIEGGEKEELLSAQIDPDDTTRIRQIIPVIQDRRLDLY